MKEQGSKPALSRPKPIPSPVHWGDARRLVGAASLWTSRDSGGTAYQGNLGSWRLHPLSRFLQLQHGDVAPNAAPSSPAICLPDLVDDFMSSRAPCRDSD